MLKELYKNSGYTMKLQRKIFPENILKRLNNECCGILLFDETACMH
jgi:hypothetical protein